MSVPWRQAVLEQGLRQEGLNIYSAGNRLIHLDLTDLDAPYPFVLGIPQSDFESCLRDRLGELGGEVEFGRRCTELSRLGRGAPGRGARHTS